MKIRIFLSACALAMSCVVPEHAQGYTTRSEMVAMRDGVRLYTEIYQPLTALPPWPVILLRTPYKVSSAIDPVIATVLCDVMQYTLIIQNTRGRFQSEGVDSLYFSDAWGDNRDGYDMVAWIADRSWCNGKIGSWGASALGITQYMTAGANPPDLDCCIVIVAAANLYEDAFFYHGVYRESLVDEWLKGNDAGEFIDLLTAHPLYDALYDRVNLLTRPDSVHVPVLHVGGWHDIFVQGQINAFTSLQQQGGEGARGRQKLIIGPWVHDVTKANTGDLTFPDNNPLQLLQWMVDWFEYYLKDSTSSPAADFPAVRYYLMGDPDQPDGPGNTWLESEIWPPDYESIPVFLRADGRLTQAKPAYDEGAETYVFDPADPVPTVGGRNLNIPAGPKDQRETESRDDVLVFTTDPLEEALVITGPVSVTLYAASDALDTDFTAKLCDVYPDGRSMLIADGIVRARFRNSVRQEDFIVPGAVFAYDIDLWSTAVAFAPGHQVRVSISSSNSPRFSVNPNTGEPFRRETGLSIAQQTVYHSAQYASALLLPVISGMSPVQTVVQDKPIPLNPGLSKNYPNPFNESTVIPVFLPPAGSGTVLQIFDLRGRECRTWNLSGLSGETRVIWDGLDTRGQRLPSGVYVAQLRCGTRVWTHKMMLMQ